MGFWAQSWLLILSLLHCTDNARSAPSRSSKTQYSIYRITQCTCVCKVNVASLPYYANASCWCQVVLLSSPTKSFECTSTLHQLYSCTADGRCKWSMVPTTGANILAPQPSMILLWVIYFAPSCDIATARLRSAVGLGPVSNRLLLLGWVGGGWDTPRSSIQDNTAFYSRRASREYLFRSVCKTSAMSSPISWM